ncbi:MAG: spermidine/putrescine ABC transporter substrate-binding protein [Elusimicrobia bacterium]|nr:spermidine/putrescine ABC transporter substrate-binding protein [Elusimicrobiota bacterium]
MLTRRAFVKSGLSVLVLPNLLAACSKKEETGVVNFFNWSQYIGKRTLETFKQSSGIRVQYSLYGDEDEMFSKLRTGIQGYDLIVATDYMLPKLKALNLIDPMPHDRLQNMGNLDPTFQSPDFDPNLDHTVPYLWGTTGIAYNRRYIKKTPDSWWNLWDKSLSGKISMLDNRRDGLSCALLMLNLPIDSSDPRHLNRAKELLLEQKPVLKHYTSTTDENALVSQDVWLAMGWNGDVVRAAADNANLDFTVPKEGSFIWTDFLCLVHGSKRRTEALLLIDHILKADVAAEIVNSIIFATPNLKARPLIAPSIAGDDRIFPDALTMKRLRFYALLSGEAEALWNRVWQEVKIG